MPPPAPSTGPRNASAPQVGRSFPYEGTPAPCFRCPTTSSHGTGPDTSGLILHSRNRRDSRSSPNERMTDHKGEYSMKDFEQVFNIQRMLDRTKAAFAKC